jgi:hypothetical protein
MEEVTEDMMALEKNWLEKFFLVVDETTEEN